MKAKDIDEVMKLQSEFMRKQFGTVTEQFQRMTAGLLQRPKMLRARSPKRFSRRGWSVEKQ